MSINNKIIKEEDNWLNEHGQPSYEYLQQLVSDGSVESLEKLRSIATDLDVEFEQNTSAQMLADLISSSSVDDDPQVVS